MDFRLSRKSASDDDDDDDNKRIITVVVQAQCCPHLELNVNHHQTVFTTSLLRLLSKFVNLVPYEDISTSN